MKTSKKKRIACLTFCTFCAFYAFYAHRLFSFCPFWALLCVWNLFVKEYKTSRVPSFILLLRVHLIFFYNPFQSLQSFSIVSIFFIDHNLFQWYNLFQWSISFSITTIFFSDRNLFQWSQSFSIITIFFNHHNLFQSPQSFSVTTIFFNFFYNL